MEVRATYYKFVIEGWIEADPSTMELSNLAWEMEEGTAKCIRFEVVKTTNDLKEVDEAVGDFFGDPFDEDSEL